MDAHLRRKWEASTMDMDRALPGRTSSFYESTPYERLSQSGCSELHTLPKYFRIHRIRPDFIYARAKQPARAKQQGLEMVILRLHSEPSPSPASIAGWLRNHTMHSPAILIRGTCRQAPA